MFSSRHQTAAITVQPPSIYDNFPYSSSETGSHHSLAVPSPGTSTARWANQLSGAAPCQCFTSGGITTTLEAYLYGSGRPLELELDWGRSYGPLWPGHYRVTKWFSAEQPAGDNTDFLLAAEFTLE